MTTRFSFLTTGARAGLRGTLTAVLLAFLALTSWGQGGTNSGGDPDADGNNASSPGEEVTSLPMVNDAPGLTFVGSLQEIRALGLSIQGRGQVIARRIGRHQFAVTLFGDYRVELDRRALVSSSVAVLFHGGAPFQDGVARLVVGSSAPELLDADRVPLPVARVASLPRAQGSLITMTAAGSNSHRARIEATFEIDRVVLVQRLR